jgi:hypothetical protein
MTSSISGDSARSPRPPFQSRGPAISVCQRLFGDRSTLMIGLLLLGLVGAVAGASRPGQDVWHSGGSAAFFVTALLMGSRDNRIHAVAIGLLAGLIWAMAEMPAAVVVGGGVIAASAHYGHARATEQLDAQAPVQTRTELAPLVRRIVLLKIANALTLAPAMAAFAYQFLLGRTASAEQILILLGVGTIVYAYVVYRDAREFDASVVGRLADLRPA